MFTGIYDIKGSIISMYYKIVFRMMISWIQNILIVHCEIKTFWYSLYFWYLMNSFFLSHFRHVSTSIKSNTIEDRTDSIYMNQLYYVALLFCITLVYVFNRSIYLTFYNHSLNTTAIDTYTSPATIWSVWPTLWFMWGTSLKLRERSRLEGQDSSLGALFPHQRRCSLHL